MIYFVTAIGTDSGKTIVSAILTEALNADYWKPIQAGLPKDSQRIKELITNNKSEIIPERYLLNTPASPHYAAAIDEVKIKIEDFEIPSFKADSLIIEGAGGVLVPINDNDFVIDVAQQLGAELIVVCNLYLGSINHTLLTFSELKRRGMNIGGLVFNGPSNPASEEIILKHTKARKLFSVLPTDVVDKEWIRLNAEELRGKI